MDRTFRVPHSYHACIQRVPRMSLRISVMDDDLLGAVIYFGCDAKQTCRTLRSLYHNEPVTLDLVNLLLHEKRSALFEADIVSALAWLVAGRQTQA